MGSETIVVLGTGGTIAGTASCADDGVGYRAAQLGIEDLIAAVPAMADVSLQLEQVAQMDSKDMEPEVWRALALRCAHWLDRAEVRAVVITHGTDTLEETAYFLQRVLAPSQPVVMVSAIRPATALMPDGPQNLRDAFVVARSPGARGVLAVCAGTVHDAMHVSKRHPYRLDAFTSGEAGPVAVVEEGAVRLLRGWDAEATVSAPGGFPVARLEPAASWPRVEIVMSHAGADGALVDALVDSKVDGLVVATTGNGTVHHRLEAALKRARERGVKVLRATRCAEGSIVGSQEDSTQLPHAGALSPVKARIELQLQLMAGRWD